jgi:histidine kinase
LKNTEETIAGFNIVETIHQNERSAVYKAIRLADNKKVILKTINKIHPSPEEIASLSNEYNTISSINKKGVIEVLEKIEYNNKPVIVQEDIDGLSLASLLKSSPFSILDFLELSLNIIEALEGVHKSGYTHKDINPSNIIFNPVTKELRLIDFELSSRLNFERSSTIHPNKLEGTLGYISPEQTGRMNRSIDYRSDFYSLGISFFQFLTGKLPFQSDDRMEMIHFHLARSMPHAENFESLPSVLFNIILKLTAKDAEDRYQSAVGLKHDLERCSTQYKATGDIADFELGLHERVSQFHIPEKLYGREKEIKALLKAFANIENGGSNFLLIKGYSGIGKTILINELQKPVVRKKGYFISGKYDQFKSSPYAAFAQAFSQLGQYLLSENAEDLDSIKTDLINGLGLNIRVLTEFVPEFKLIIGEQPLAQDLNPKEAKSRFLFAFREFIQVFAAPNHPLVIFLDDLQWAEESSLRLIKDLSTAGIENLLIIGAYRDNEIHETHPLAMNLAEIGKQRKIEEIELVGLESEHINQLLSDTLKVPKENCESLANLICSRTEGNPFFVNEMLNSFYQEGIFTFNEAQNNWQWSENEIEKNDVSENVADYILSKINQLPKDCIDSLEVAACIGSTFDLKTLELISDKNAFNTLETLWPAVKSNMILPLSDNYRLISENQDFGVSFKFQHDRIQQAVYQRRKTDERQQIHLRIGDIMLQNLNTVNDIIRNETIRHFNLAQSLINDNPKRTKSAELNLLSGQRALKAIAYQVAFDYFSNGLKFLSSDKWTNHYELCFDLYLGYCQSAYLIQNYTLAEEAIELLLSKAKTKLQKVEVLGIKLRQYTTMGKTEEAVREGIAGLKILGTVLPEYPSSFTVLKEVLKAKWNLRNTSPEKLLGLPLNKDPEKKAIARLLTEIGPSAYVLGNDNLYGLTQLKLVNLSVKHGNTSESAFAYTAYGTVLSEAFGDLKSQYEFGQLALKLNEKLNDVEYRCRVISAYGVLVFHFNNHWKENTSWFEEGVKAGYLSADLFFWAYSASNCHVFDSDQTIATRIEGQLKYLKITKETGYRDAFQGAMINLQYTRCLAGLTDSPTSLDGDDFTEAHCMKIMQELKFNSGFGFYNVHKAHLYYNEYMFKEAYEHVTEASKYLGSMTSLIQATNLQMLSGLICSGYILDGENPPNELRKRLVQSISKLSKWNKYNPVNFSHKFHLLKAELYSVDEKNKKATIHYRQAIAKANKNNWPVDEALANELFGKYHYRNGDKRAASGYFREALFLYAKMGMRAKVELLQRKFQNQVTDQVSQTSFSVLDSTMESSTVGEEIDLTSIIKASQAISKEIKIDALLEKVMRIIMQNAGAENGTLILKIQDEYVIQASAQGEAIKSMENVPAKESSNIPHSIVNYVINSAEPLLLNNAQSDDHYSNDHHVVKQQIKSVLCCPILLFGKLFGVIYLENNVSTRAFTEDRLHVLKLLSSQMAISIQNAFLYAHLEEQVEERTLQLSKEKEKSDNLLHNILPEQIANELKIKGESKARLFESVSVIFTDFADFTKIGSNFSPNELVSQLDHFFSQFDEINRRFGIEKIKTIGDSYMAASGLPEPSEDFNKRAVLAALEMQKFIENHYSEHVKAGKPAFKMRVGIHTGPVIAGIVGIKKFQYDIWGDTVNTASRMESSGEIGKVNISQATYELLKNDSQFVFENRGKIKAKGKGEMEMWFVSAKAEQ